MRPRDYVVTVYYRGRVHELLASGTTPGAALDNALKDDRRLHAAVKSGKAGYEVRTLGVAS